LRRTEGSGQFSDLADVKRSCRVQRRPAQDRDRDWYILRSLLTPARRDQHRRELITCIAPVDSRIPIVVASCRGCERTRDRQSRHKPAREPKAPLHRTRGAVSLNSCAIRRAIPSTLAHVSSSSIVTRLGFVLRRGSARPCRTTRNPAATAWPV
jgi:hypothetical protein